jgi:hypothetical protein
MPVLDTGIHVFAGQDVDGRVEPGHDGLARQRSDRNAAKFLTSIARSAIPTPCTRPSPDD